MAARRRAESTDLVADPRRPVAGDVAVEGNLLHVLPRGRGATPRPDWWASSRPQLVKRPLARHRPPNPSLPEPTPFSSYRVSHKRHKRLVVVSADHSKGDPATRKVLEHIVREYGQSGRTFKS